MARSLIVLLLCTLLLAGCETAKGVGRDMQKAGNWVEDTASR